MGVFGFAEIVRNLELPAESRDIVQSKITGLMPTRQDLIDSSGAIARGTVLGSLLGILPGGGAVIASFAAYTFEKDRKSTRLNSSHTVISYAVFCLKKKTTRLFQTMLANHHIQHRT